jgi:hypothetical protein
VLRLAAADRVWSALSPRARLSAAALLPAVATLPVLARQYIGKTQSDIQVYLDAVDALLQGRLYDGHVFEYPPYALIWFLAPYAWASHDLQNYRLAFGIEIWLFDAAIKATLLWRAFRARRGFPDLLPFFVYSLGSAALGHVLLMRYDLIPAGLSLAGALAVVGGFPFVGGAVTALAAGTKVYPALFIPILAIVAWHRRGAGRFAAGVAVASVPLLLLAAWMPWWNFVAFHGARGLEAGSSLASVIWSLHRLAGVDASWGLVGTSNEVGGPLASQLLGPARAVWVASTLACLGVASASALRAYRVNKEAMTPASLAMLMLLPIVAFVATNTVLSPQFHLWLIPLAAVVLEGRSILPPHAARGAWAVFLATMVVPAFFPHREFGRGLGVGLTGVLVLRNALLAYAAVALWKAAILFVSAASQKPDQRVARSLS